MKSYASNSNSTRDDDSTDRKPLELKVTQYACKVLDNLQDFPSEFETAFAASIFELGLKYSSPKVIIPLLPKESEVNKEHIKSHLQKYRIHHQRSREEFMIYYNKHFRDNFAEWVLNKRWNSSSGHVPTKSVELDADSLSEESIVDRSRKVANFECADVIVPPSANDVQQTNKEMVISPFLGAAFSSEDHFFETIKRPTPETASSESKNNNEPIKVIKSSSGNGSENNSIAAEKKAVFNDWRRQCMSSLSQVEALAAGLNSELNSLDKHLNNVEV